MVFRDSGGQEIQIYDTSYLFVFGDLNYRISLNVPEKLPLNRLAEKIGEDPNSLLPHDQLWQQRSQNRTLHGLSEGKITFPPTYKYVVGTRRLKVGFKARQSLSKKFMPCL